MHILDSQRAWVDAGRMRGYLTAIELDRITHGTPDHASRWDAPARALRMWQLPESDMSAGIVTHPCAATAG